MYRPRTANRPPSRTADPLQKNTAEMTPGENRVRPPAADSGLYVLWLHVADAVSVNVGALGSWTVEPGLFAYVGSARRGRSARIARHLRTDKVRRWHIDYFRPAGHVVAVTYVDAPELTECRLAEHLADRLEGTRAIPRFGSSDCRCPGHLLRFADLDAWSRASAIVSPATTVPSPATAP